MGGSWDILLGPSSLGSTRSLPHTVLPQQVEDVSPAPCRPAHGPTAPHPPAPHPPAPRPPAPRPPAPRPPLPRLVRGAPGAAWPRDGAEGPRGSARAATAHGELQRGQEGREGGREEEEEALCGRKRGCCSWQLRGSAEPPPQCSASAGSPQRPRQPRNPQPRPEPGAGAETPTPSRQRGRGESGERGARRAQQAASPPFPVPSRPLPSRPVPFPPRPVQTKARGRRRCR